MVNKMLKLVNVVQVMHIHRILPCQQRAFNLWEFDPAQHQTLSELFDTMHKDVWRVLFKGAEIPPSLTKDRGLSAKRRAPGAFGEFYTSGRIFISPSLIMCGV